MTQSSRKTAVIAIRWSSYQWSGHKERRVGTAFVSNSYITCILIMFSSCSFSKCMYDTIRYDTTEEFNVDSKAEYTA